MTNNALTNNNELPSILPAILPARVDRAPELHPFTGEPMPYTSSAREALGAFLIVAIVVIALTLISSLA